MWPSCGKVLRVCCYNKLIRRVPFWFAVFLRCLGVLEGLALQVDPSFRIVKHAYPYVAARLLADPSPRLQGALEKLLFVDGRLNVERLEDLMEQATEVDDFNMDEAADQFIAFLISDRGEDFRETLASQLVDSIDRLETEASALLVANLSRDLVLRSLLHSLRNLRNLITADTILPMIDQAQAYIFTYCHPDSTLYSFGRVMRILRQTKGISAAQIAQIARKVLRQPVLQELIGRVTLALTERMSSKMVRRVFGRPRRK